MKTEFKELQRLKGVGEVLSQRFVEAGYDTFAKIAAAGEDELKKIRGLNPRIVQSIIAQAGEMAGEEHKSKEQIIGELKARVSSLKCQAQAIALSVRDRYVDKVAGKTGKKVELELVKIVSSLEKVEGKIGNKVKKAGKGLAKAEKRLADLTDSGLKGIGKGLKKARKSLKRVYV
jgi:Helix-hairpin-helix domain